MRYVFCFALLCLLQMWACQAPTNNVTIESPVSIEIFNFEPQVVPQELQYRGKVVSGKHWNDNNGECWLLLCETGVKNRKTTDTTMMEMSDTTQDAFIEIRCYAQNEGKTTLLWQHNDSISGCMGDVVLNYIPNALSLADNDGDGVAEALFMYKKACRFDVSPIDLHLFLAEGNEVFRMTGSTKIKAETMGTDTDMGGNVSQSNVPEAFAQYAEEYWENYRLEEFK